jgi:hypothetical protein
LFLNLSWIILKKDLTFPEIILLVWCISIFICLFGQQAFGWQTFDRVAFDWQAFGQQAFSPWAFGQQAFGQQAFGWQALSQQI